MMNNNWVLDVFFVHVIGIFYSLKLIQIVP